MYLVLPGPSASTPSDLSSLTVQIKSCSSPHGVATRSSTKGAYLYYLRAHYTYSRTSFNPLHTARDLSRSPTVHRVSELSLARARIAYLSACSTAENKAARLSDEVIHVVSGFQVVGFPHVVGCLLPSIDGVCVEVASGFYGSLLQRGTTGLNGYSVASAMLK